MDPVGYELCTPEGDKGGGVRATRGFEAGETVMIGFLEGEVARNDSHATQVSRTKWARHGGLGPKVNHSCNPNCGVELNETGACRGSVTGWKDLPAERKADYEGLVAPYLLEIDRELTASVA